MKLLPLCLALVSEAARLNLNAVMAAKSEAEETAAAAQELSEVAQGGAEDVQELSETAQAEAEEVEQLSEMAEVSDMAEDEAEEEFSEEAEALSEEEVLAAMESFQMLEAVSMASGWLNVSDGAADHEALGMECKNMWPSELNGKYSGARYVGAGATACVFLARDKRRQTVAVKVGKMYRGGPSKQQQMREWSKECKQMKKLRMQACEGGKNFLLMHEHYIPSCLGWGSFSRGVYLVMHAAGDKVLSSAPRMGLSSKQKENIFAQLLEGLYALHGIKMSHNDLHSRNAVLDGDQLQIIDLGSLRPVARSYRKGYKRDSNAVWRWGAMLADCPSDAKWGRESHSELKKRAKKFEACISKKWKPDWKFKKALRKLLEGDLSESAEHHIIDLYKTKWVSSRTPKLLRKYVMDETKGCSRWSQKQWDDYWKKNSN